MDDAELLETWQARDEARALLPEDRKLAANIGAARALVAELAVRATHGDGESDLYNACASLGWVLGREGASPTLAASVMDGLREALGGPTPTWLEAARAALLETYVTARLDVAGESARRAWEYPMCAVPLGDGRVAITAGYPDDDGERLAEWAARAARGMVRAGVRHARVAGGEHQVAALVAALDFAGIEVDLLRHARAAAACGRGCPGAADGADSLRHEGDRLARVQ